jgi:Transposase IS116/IS110/IS902 family
MRGEHAALVQALDGRFDDHHGELARILLDQVDGLDRQIQQLTTTIDTLIAAMPAATGQPQPPAPGGDHPAPTDPSGAGEQPMSVIARLDEIPGIAEHTAQVIIAELGLDMRVFPTPGHLVSWARLSPRTIQSGAKHRGGKTGKGNPYLKGVLGEAAAAAAKTNTFLGERYRRIVKRRGKLKALVAVARSILVIVWHLLADPLTRYQDLGPDWHTTRLNTHRKPATWSTSSKPSATPSPCNPPPNGPTPPPGPAPAGPAIPPAQIRPQRWYSRQTRRGHQLVVTVAFRSASLSQSFTNPRRSATACAACRTTCVGRKTASRSRVDREPS